MDGGTVPIATDVAARPSVRPQATTTPRATSIGRADTRAIAVLVALIAVIAWNRLIFDSWLTRMDLLTFFLPWYSFLGERLRDLDVPGWSPHLFSGAPFAGDPESGWMYAPAMLVFALFSSATAAFKGMVVVHLGIAALSTYAFARVLGMGALASLVAAVTYLVGPFLHWNTHCCLIFAQFATWIPLALLGVELALRAGGWRDRLVPCCLSGFAISQMFAGWIGEGWLYAVLLPAAYIGYRTLLSPPRPGISLTTRLAVGAATGFAILASGMALAAAGMLPRYAVNAETNLAGGDYSRLGDAAVLNPPWSLDYLLVQTLGNGTGYHFRAAAIGGAAVILSLLALPLARRRFAAPFFAALTISAMILTLETTPLHQLFYLIPRYREFHDHDAWRTISLAAIGPAMLSGAAIESLPRWRGRHHLLPWLILPLLLLIIVAMALWWGEISLGWTPLVAAALTTGLIGIVVVTPRPDSQPLSRERPHPQPLSRRAGRGELGQVAPLPPATDRDVGTTFASDVARLVPALVLVVIFLFPTGLEMAGSWLDLPREGSLWRHLQRDPGLAAALEVEVSRSDPFGAGAFLQEQLALSGPFRYAGYGGFGFPGDARRQESYMGRRLDPNVQAILVNGRPIFLGLYDVQGYNPLQLARYVEFMTALNGAPQDYHTAFLMPSGVRSPLLDLLDVRYLLVDASLPQYRDDVVALTEGHRQVLRTPRVIVYERVPNTPHAWIVHDVRQVARGEALLLLANEIVNPFRTALVEGTPPETEQPARLRSDSVQVIQYEPDGITIETASSAAGLLVVSEVYASGWQAYLDGERVSLLPTNHALQGVPLPAGDHTVELRYEPLALRVGLIVSGVAAAVMLVALAIAGWAHWARRERTNSTTSRTAAITSSGSST